MLLTPFPVRVQELLSLLFATVLSAVSRQHMEKNLCLSNQLIESRLTVGKHSFDFTVIITLQWCYFESKIDVYFLEVVLQGCFLYIFLISSKIIIDDSQF